MAQDKDNSLNYTENNEDLLGNDGSSRIENEKELEKYGVWVKTGPRGYRT